MLDYSPLWRVIDKSALVLFGTVVAVGPEDHGTIAIREVLRGVRPETNEILVRALPPDIEAPPFSWREGEEVATCPWYTGLVRSTHSLGTGSLLACM